MSDTKAQHGRASPARAPRAIRIIDRVSVVMSYGASAALVLMGVNIIVDVIGRSFFQSPFLGTLELTSFWWMPTLTILAFAVTERYQEHIKVTLLLDSLPVRMRRIVEGCVSVLSTLLLIAVTWFTLVNALDAAEIGQTTNSAPPISIWPFTFVAVAGVAMLAIQTAATAYRHFAGLLPESDDLQAEGDLA